MKTVTIDNLAESTAQEVFDFIVSSLLKQGEQCCDVDGICAMRGINGTCCAAGFLVPDDKYDEQMELKDWYEVIDEFKISESHMCLIAHLQGVHDAYSADQWGDYFEQVAQEYELNTEVLS